MKKNYNGKVLIKVKKAIRQFSLLKEGDKIAVGLSGGKDSTTLFYLLHILKKQLLVNFEIVPINLGVGFDIDNTPLRLWIEKLGYDLVYRETSIANVVFDIRQEERPCSLCANMRRGALNNVAKELGCNKVALGHHLDDEIETFFLNIFYAGKMGIFQPKTYLSRIGLEVIRPMIFVQEEAIKSMIKEFDLPVINSCCPKDGHSKRQEMKELVIKLQLQFPSMREKFMTSFLDVETNAFWISEPFQK
ncbi:MAG: ATP-binding protein [Clostridia bacterium]